MTQTPPPLAACIVPVTPLQQNCTLFWCTETMKGALVDPGGDLDRLKQVVAEKGVTLEKLLITHGHLDHCGMAGVLAEDLSLPIEGPHPEDKFWIDQATEQGERFGMIGTRPFTPERWLDEGDMVTVGRLSLSVFHCPGHTPGHVVFYHEPSKLLIVGDVLFQGSIGRTDFPRGNHQQLVDAIQQKLFTLPEDTAFVPGHGPMSTIGQEKRTNPFVGAYG
ncbi:MBL fold metallo-hydrolase [Pacificimonas flava]|uniref:Metal-binding enzyme YcbL n=1 Tax=Pacificimonas flava TaxID=1234595 RepID=M2U354_9SPHN|nr:MBL fold metallo-hydrolase [Pacificimonas flava]EMD82422.1 metal-binding enzyme YcbL [Pacificimonas flava]MBB5281256.1 glyoxylase-like metal-dependent hydrolase (beta-lactamase superfamily II) [Pacificimonas flava]